MNIWLYVISSAALYAASFLWIKYFWWGAFLFLIPLFLISRTRKFTFTHGFIWGIVTYSLQLFALLVLIIEQGSGWLRFFAPCVVIGWFAVFAGLWFYSLNVRNVWVQVIVTLLFFLSIDLGILTPFFGHLEGYPFALPLLPLMYGVQIGLLPFIGKINLLVGLILIQNLAAHAYVFLSITLTILLFFIVPINHQKSEWKDKCIAVPFNFIEQTPYERAQEICHVLIDTVQKHPEKRMIVLAESVFPWPLEQHQYAIDMWTENALLQNTHLILGAYRKKGEKCLNSFYNVYQGRIIFYYDKTHLIPFFEKTNSSLLLRKGNDLFLSTKESFTPGTCRASLLKTEFLPPITPRVCSEIFWHMPRQTCVIALIKDSYFSLSYYFKLMQLLAQMNALEQNTELFYCSWRSNF